MSSTHKGSMPSLQHCLVQEQACRASACKQLAGCQTELAQCQLQLQTAAARCQAQSCHIGRLHQRSDLQCAQLDQVVSRHHCRRTLQRCFAHWMLDAGTRAQRHSWIAAQLAWHTRCQGRHELQAAFTYWKQACRHARQLVGLALLEKGRQRCLHLRHGFKAWRAWAAVQSWNTHRFQHLCSRLHCRSNLRQAWLQWLHMVEHGRQRSSMAQACKQQRQSRLCRRALAAWRLHACKLAATRRACTRRCNVHQRMPLRPPFAAWRSITQTQVQRGDVLACLSRQHSRRCLAHAVRAWQRYTCAARSGHSKANAHLCKRLRERLAASFVAWRNFAQQVGCLRRLQLRCRMASEQQRQQCTLLAWQHQHWTHLHQQAAVRCVPSSHHRSHHVCCQPP